MPALKWQQWTMLALAIIAAAGTVLNIGKPKWRANTARDGLVSLLAIAFQLYLVMSL